MHVLEHFVEESTFSIGFWTATNILERYVCSKKQQYRSSVRACMSLNREHSKAQRNPSCTKQQTKYVPIRVSYVSKQVCTYQVYACCVPFVFLEHGALSICKSPVCTKNVEPSTLFATSSVCHSNPCLIVSERSGRNRCTDIQQHHYSSTSSMYEYVCCR